jgi:hypothetical protein
LVFNLLDEFPVGVAFFVSDLSRFDFEDVFRNFNDFNDKRHSHRRVSRKFLQRLSRCRNAKRAFQGKNFWLHALAETESGWR